LALVIRLLNIGRESFWFDEAFSYLSATSGWSQLLLNQIESSHPPFYYLLLRFWISLGVESDGGLRLLGVGWNLLLLPLIYWLANRLLGRARYGWWAVILVAVSPFHLLYSHELRMLTQVMTLAVLGVICFWLAWQRDQWWWWLGFAIFALLAVCTHLLAWLVWAGVGLFAWGQWWQKREAAWGKLVKTAVVIGLIVLLFSPWVYAAVTQPVQEVGSFRPLYHTPERDWLKPLIIPAFLLFGMSFEPIYVGLASFLLLAIVLITLLELRKVWLHGGLAPGVQLCGLIFLTVIGLPSLVYLIRPFFLPERALAVAAPFLVILVAWGTGRRQSPLPYLAGGTVLLMMVGSLLYQTGPPVKPPYRDAVQFVEAHRQPDDLIVHTSDGSYLPALRYTTDGHLLLAGDPDPRRPRYIYEMWSGTVVELDDLEEQDGRLWLIVALEHSAEWQQEQAAQVRQQYPLLAAYDFAGIIVLLYDIDQWKES
jgi:4-amino-4-deoxy-L-arabinose transferase-like glycosyltransferase